MDLKPILSILLFLGILFMGCSQEDACKPRDITFCLDEHRMWTCAPDGNPEKGSLPYIIEVVDCRTYAGGQKPYCVTKITEDGTRGSTYCRADPNWPPNSNKDAGDATSHDIESDED